jgi:hypothetical protein
MYNKKTVIVLLVAYLGYSFFLQASHQNYCIKWDVILHATPEELVLCQQKREHEYDRYGVARPLEALSCLTRKKSKGKIILHITTPEGKLLALLYGWVVGDQVRVTPLIIEEKEYVKLRNSLMKETLYRFSKKKVMLMVFTDKQDDKKYMESLGFKETPEPLRNRAYQELFPITADLVWRGI